MDSQASQVFAQEVSRFSVLTAVTVLYFDYLLTFADEVRLFWVPQRFSFAAFFFFVARYTTIFGHIPIIIATFGQFGQERCSQLQYYHQGFSALVIVLLMILLIMRTYALYQCNRRILWLLILTAAIAILGGGAVLLASEIAIPAAQTVLQNSGQVNCDPVVSQTHGYYLAASWAAVLGFDSLVFCMTLYQSMRLNLDGIIKNRIGKIMIRDGILYYGVVVLLYIINIIMFFVCPPLYRGLFVSFTNVMASTLMNRLMLHVRRSAESCNASWIEISDTAPAVSV